MNWYSVLKYGIIILMQREKLKLLFDLDVWPFENNDIDSKVLKALDDVIIESVDENNCSDEILSVYKKFQPMKKDVPESMKNELISTIRNFAKNQKELNRNLESLILYRFLVVKSVMISEDYYNIAFNISHLGRYECAGVYAKLYDKKEENRPLAYLLLGDLYKNNFTDYKMAIKYYVKFVGINSTKPSVYNIIADLYSKAYGDEKIEEQIYYYQKALDLNPENRLSMHGLAFCYEKLGNKEKARYFYQMLLNNNPTETDFYNYGMFLISCGDFINGHNYFRKRFNLNNINLSYPLAADKKWDLESDISDKILLVHYEQGFGDTIMYCRFLSQLKKFAKKIIFVVQKELYDLISGSDKIFEGIEIRTEFSDKDYDYSMALLDAPYVLKTKAEELPLSNAYINVSKDKINEFGDKYINKNNKLKVGFACYGDKSANYNDRNINIEKLNMLFGIENTEFYFLQKEEISSDKFISLGRYFSNFSDSACAIMCMDIVISTDNVILNLAGALGVKTLGLFNKQTNFRWFRTEGDDVGWYSCVKPIQAQRQNDWSKVLLKVADQIKKEQTK